MSENINYSKNEIICILQQIKGFGIYKLNGGSNFYTRNYRDFKMKLQLLEEKKSIIAISLFLSYKAYLNIFETSLNIHSFHSRASLSLLSNSSLHLRGLKLIVIFSPFVFLEF